MKESTVVIYGGFKHQSWPGILPFASVVQTHRALFPVDMSAVNAAHTAGHPHFAIHLHNCAQLLTIIFRWSDEGGLIGGDELIHKCNEKSLHGGF